MKVLWFSNNDLHRESVGSGSWLYAMSGLLAADKNVELYNITVSNVSRIIFSEKNNIRQYLLPRYKLNSKLLPGSGDIGSIMEVVDGIRPDIIHVWGMENYASRFAGLGYFSKYKVLLEIQGILSECAESYYAGMTYREKLKIVALRDFLKPSTSAFFNKKLFHKRGSFEKEILNSHEYISTQSDWVRSRIKNMAPNARIYQTKIPLRESFIGSEKWEDKKDKHIFTIFTVSGYFKPFKGYHVFFKAVKELKKRYGDIRVVVGGPFCDDRPFYKKDGYMKYLASLAKELGEGCVEYAGVLNAEEIKSRLLQCDVFVNPSFVETYSVITAEALALGVPSVISYAGAMPELADDKTQALFYPSGDYKMCAFLLEKLAREPDLRRKLSGNILASARFNDVEEICRKQISIYEEILSI